MITSINTSGIDTPERAGDFEELYIATRKKEGRLYSDEEVAVLPAIAPGHMHRKEWLLRKKSADRLCNYLISRKRSLAILEIGCGNGWLSNLLSGIPNADVTGSDINVTELQQAKRVFFGKPNLFFVCSAITGEWFEQKQFDIIVFAASIQYFNPFGDAIRAALALLAPAGEIHIVDTHFYKKEETAAAQERSDAYYTTAGAKGMTAFYFHHSTSMLEPFHYRFQSSPSKMINRIFNRGFSLPWIRIKK